MSFPILAQLQRVGGIAFGVATHGVFFFTVYHLFRFLYADKFVSPTGSLGIDIALASQFAILHSALLHPAIRQRLTRWIPRAFYGCFFCVVTCLSLLGLFAGWRTVGASVWLLTGGAGTLMESAFFLSWGALFYSLYLAGLGYQTGFTPWWSWVQRRALRHREFSPRSLFLLIRHPVYLSFLGLIWFNPVMTIDRLLLAVTWTVYIFIGSYLKDERLASALGEMYREYQARVPGYPLMPFGPFARRRPATEADILPIRQPATMSRRSAA